MVLRPPDIARAIHALVKVFQSPCGEMVLRLVAQQWLQVIREKFQSPCGEMVLRQSGLKHYFYGFTLKVSVPLRGNGLATRPGKIQLHSATVMFQSPCGEMVLRLAKSFRSPEICVSFQSPCGEMVLRQSNNKIGGNYPYPSFSPLAGKWSCDYLSEDCTTIETSEFQSPCGEMVLRHSIETTLPPPVTEFQSPCGEMVLRPQLNHAPYQPCQICFSPLAGKWSCDDCRILNITKSRSGFQSPCGEMVLRRKQRVRPSLFTHYRVSVPLRGNGLATENG